MTLNPRGGKLSCRNASAALAHFLQTHFTSSHDGERSDEGDSGCSESLNTILSLSVVNVITMCDQLFGALAVGRVAELQWYKIDIYGVRRHVQRWNSFKKGIARDFSKKWGCMKYLS